MPRPRHATPASAQSQADALRALRAAERGGVRPSPFGAPWPIAFCYANTYHVGMSSLGFQALVARINARGDAQAERFFWDVSHPNTLGGRARRPHLEDSDLDYAGADLVESAPANWPTEAPLSVENLRQLREFPVVCFSIAFEMDYLHLVDMLVRAGIEPWTAKRGPRDPLIVVGGSAVTMNRLPIYDFVDVVVHGDGEQAVDVLADVLAENGAGRERLREALRGRPGFEVTTPREPQSQPWLDYDPAPPVAASRLSMAEHLLEIPTHSHILTPHTEFADRALIELSRGCPYKCTFCIMGYQPFKYHYRPAAEIERMARALMPLTRKFGLVASAVGVHREIEDVCDRLMRLGASVSFSSLRVEDVKPRMVDALLASGQKTLTIAPEAGNDALRIRQRKRLSNARIEAFVRDVIERGMQHIKLYFMIGVHTETDDDVASIATLTERLHHAQVEAARAHGRIGHLALNVGVFVPKPGTPQHEGGFVGVAEARRRLRLLQRELKPIRNIKVHFSNPHLAAAQTILSCGDRRAADYLWWAWRHARGNWPAATRQFEDLLGEHLRDRTGESAGVREYGVAEAGE